jgi:hypothetical protein
MVTLCVFALGIVNKAIGVYHRDRVLGMPGAALQFASKSKHNTMSSRTRRSAR